MPSFRTSNFNKENNKIELTLNHDLLDEKRERTKIHQATYKHRSPNTIIKELSIDLSFQVT